MSLFIYILSISPRVSLTKVISFVSLCRRRNPRRKPVLKIFDSSLLHKRQRQDVLFLVSHPMMVDWLKTSLQTVKENNTMLISFLDTLYVVFLFIIFISVTPCLIQLTLVREKKCFINFKNSIFIHNVLLIRMIHDKFKFP